MNLLQQVIKQRRDEFDEKFGGEGIIAKTDENMILIGFTKKEVKSHNQETIEAILKVVKEIVDVARYKIYNEPVDLCENSQNFKNMVVCEIEKICSSFDSTLQDIKNNK